jgi:hypothetical protein
MTASAVLRFFNITTAWIYINSIIELMLYCYGESVVGIIFASSWFATFLWNTRFLTLFHIRLSQPNACLW